MSQQIYNSDFPSFHILICLIKIWKHEKGTDPMKVPEDAMLISECEEIEIEESYKKLIGTASVKFPRGTIIRKTITDENLDEAMWGAHNELNVNISQTGVIEEIRNRKTQDVVSTSSFDVGNRIRIYLGYTTDSCIANSAKTSATGITIFNDSTTLAEYEKHMNIMFDGYITKVSVDTPVELHCENLASALKTITCPKVTLKSKDVVNDLFGEKGKYNLLKNTGLKLHPKNKTQKYDLGKIALVPDLTVADVLTEWSKYGVSAFITTDDSGNAVLAVGRNYFDNAKDDAVINLQSQPSTPTQILFDYHVAQNGLSLTSTNKDFLAIEAEGLGVDDKFFHITVIKDTEPKDGKSKWRIVNESKVSKKAFKLGARPLSAAKNDKIDMTLYTKVPYHSRKIPIDRDDLLEEAIKYYEQYNMNGIEGSLTLFGDLHLHTALKVQLVDNRYPGKNGYYLIEEVNTTFGTEGYRQTIKMPYCIKRDKPDLQKDNKQ